MTRMRIAEIFSHVKHRIDAALDALGVDERPAIVVPPEPDMGDLGFPCFPFARVLRRNPHLIADELAATLTPDEVVASARGAKGYVNITLSTPTLAAAVLGEALERAGDFASNTVDEGRRMVVEYSAPNTNKPLHLGHVRNNVIGLSVTRTLAHVGHDVTAVNLINDRGVHICKSMIAYQRWGDGTSPSLAGMKGDHLVGDFYVMFDKKFSEEYRQWLATDVAAAEREKWLATPAGKNAQKAGGFEKAFAAAHRDHYFNTTSPLGRAARQMLREWESGDEHVRALWSRMNRWVYEGFDATYERMQVRFDKVYYESETFKLGKAIVEDGLERGIFHRLDSGAVVCDYDKLGFEESQTAHKVLLRSDGTSVYTTQDLGTAMQRYEEFRFDRMIYVVGDEQRHHFVVLFALLGLVDSKLQGACHHLAYGMVNLPEGKMKSREGKVVEADELMDGLAGLAADELRQRAASGRAHTDKLDEAEIARRAEAVAQAALKFHLLSFSAGSAVRFDPKKSISFLGRTGPYCLNAYARTQSLLEQAGDIPAFSADDVASLSTPHERAVLKALLVFPDRIRYAAENLDPSKAVDATYDIARAFNRMYTDKEGHPIERCPDEALRRGRLLLAQSVGIALRVGLRLLGIETLQEM